MSCPFPGMDPWLEAPHVWPGFREILVGKAVEILQPQLRQCGYYVDVDRRGLVDHEDLKLGEAYAEIFEAASHRLITVIDFMSLPIKSDMQCREFYRRKQQELLKAHIHLVEIDLLRSGTHALDVSHDVVERLERSDYLISLARGGADERAIWTVQLRERLPCIPVPLKASDDDAVLDLQDVFHRSYEIGPYPERLQYSQPPPPPELDPDDAAWADQILRSKGLRQ